MTAVASVELQAEDGITLRQLGPADTPELFRLVQANRTNLVETGVISDNGWSSTEDLARYLAVPGAFHFGMQSAEGLIGYVSLRRSTADAKLTFWVDKKSRGRHIASNAVRAVVSYAFENQRIPVLGASVKQNNEAPGRVLLSNGFRKLPGEYLGWNQFSLHNPNPS